MKAHELNTGKTPVWCPGCGNYAIWNALKGAIADLNLNPWEVVTVSGIGCSGKMVNHIRCYGFHSLHGRVLPVATGVKLANHKLTVIANGGDGDGYGMGMGHFVHAMRRNIDLTYIVHDNRTYGLTTGQASPTAKRGTVTKSTPEGVFEEPVNPIAFALSAGATFIARGYSGESEHLKELIKKAINHKGFALIDVLQPCVSFARDYSYDYYDSRIYFLDENYNSNNKESAFKLAFEKDKYALGIIYEDKSKPTYEEQHGVLKEKTLCEQGVKLKDISPLLKLYK
ncbi:2-oxoacid oxidoreductase, beta subunit [Deferribacter desulfuricans SSM1]|uniref:2-oxoacid oxidoreductase, beta subunit n=1 Tax=Deferribacter desulfuricans (strain DSM 14783 / JCM 11476 / NBRC 101012 / SSM1) TaxID=639282 RepID=D3PCF9_DEFDS|nr:thiamine pyrophosphate-dependent enzyme [Deferribacter desulfuricans]BAI80282.1 2-oxoacid oxidoreductase, beta subunit [Deferribacter desulfuricans SSM1]